MIVLQIKGLKKSFGVQNIFQNIEMVIQEKEKVGLVGPNGAGKTTLLRCLTGEESVDEGQVVKPEAATWGYMEQIQAYPAKMTLFETVMEEFADLLALRKKLRQLEAQMSDKNGKRLEQTLAHYARITEDYERSGGFSCEAMARRVIAGLGFNEEDQSREIQTFSGGEKTKVGLAKILVRKPDLLLLDEPTNHLDLPAVEWLESFLKSYTGALLVVSHDRYFLDQVADRTLELESGKLESYPGNFSRYVQLKEEKTAAQLKAYAKQEKYIKETEEYINRYRAGIKAKQARGRQSQLARLERLSSPKSARNIRIEVRRVKDSGNIVLDARELALSFGEKKLWEKVSFRITKKERIGLIGRNGTGKSSLFKAITGEIKPDCGEVIVGARVKPGYFAQECQDLTEQNRIIDEILGAVELTVGEARDVLGDFLFRGEEVFKQVKDLSGGEKKRLSFLKNILGGANFLLLDEPTNHLDIASRAVIEDYLSKYEGTILVISHDRYFLDRITTRTLELSEKGLEDYPGNYTSYKTKKAEIRREQEKEEKTQKNDKQRKAEGKNRSVINKAQTREKLEKLEDKIAQLEERLQVLALLLADASTYRDEDTAREYTLEYRGLEEEISRGYQQWEELMKLLVERG